MRDQTIAPEGFGPTLTDAHFKVPLSLADPEVAALIAAEHRRHADRLELVASENYVSLAQLQASGSTLGNVTVEGYPGARFLGTSMHIDALERLAIGRACRLFRARFANVQPHSGTQANQAVFLALLKPGDTILSMRLTDGGHFSHGDSHNLSGLWFKPVHYGVNAQDGRIDYDEAERQARRHRPKLIIAGGSAYPRAIDFARLADIARAVGARLMVDIAHVAGLIACQLFPDPFPHADVVTSTSYKNLRGVRGGLILSNDEALARRIDEALCPGLQGTPILSLVAGKAVAFGEALQPGYTEYNRQVLANARTLAAALAERGIPAVTGGTDTPFMVAEVHRLGLTGRAATAHLENCGIGANAVPIPGDADFEHAGGLRLGTSAITTRGLRENECVEVADIVAHSLHEAARGGLQDGTCAQQVQRICARFPLYPELLPPSDRMSQN